NRHEFLLDSRGQIERCAGMIVRFKSARAAPTRVVKMDADKNCIFLRILFGDAVIERDKDVRVSGHDGHYLRLAQLAFQTPGYIDRDTLFRWAVTAIRTAVLAAMAGIHDHCSERFGCVFDARGSNRAAGS